MSDGLAALDRTISTLTARLLERRTPSGHWEGHLASSALSTATAIIALRIHGEAVEPRHRSLVEAGTAWLVANQNSDGGWGDTTISASNLSTTLLCWAAVSQPSDVSGHDDIAVERAEGWLRRCVGNLQPETLSAAILAAYGTDRTFSAPILTVLALTHKLGIWKDGWKFVPQLPFELAACPHRWFEWLRLPVVSYALPALVAIGQVRHHHRPTRNPALAYVRSALGSRTRRIARNMQPPSGGYLEATPLTSFVVMSLISAGETRDPIVDHGVRFLASSMRADGSWPIDTNLATWVTTLSIEALGGSASLDEVDRDCLIDWLLRQQTQIEHPFTRARPGGWAWTDLSGGVPDADDTAGALMALRTLGGDRHPGAAVRGSEWLLNVQNRDGGIPTFCRGWGALPFDRSAPDLTAHALEAWDTWLPLLPPDARRRIAAASSRAIAYLARSQRSDGSWLPLWFGNEQMPGHVNQTYGTARAVAALNRESVRDQPGAATSRESGVRWLLRAQNEDGGWGAGSTASSIEETGMALHALASVHAAGISPAVAAGSRWLISTTEEGTSTPPAPIGLYFARLWYYEELYPIIFALRGLSASRTVLRNPDP